MVHPSPILSFIDALGFSPTTLLAISMVMIIMGLAATSTIDFYTALVVIVLCGMFFILRDHFSPFLIYMLAIALAVGGINSQVNLTFPFKLLCYLALGTVVAFCKFYIAAIILLNVIIMGLLLVAFVVLV